MPGKEKYAERPAKTKRNPGFAGSSCMYMSE